ncbi:MAG TPA: Spy/CpxP family protein refolding chaperone [Aliidongia sp.]|nr:Spy/CpxP family protein refolding chaperone [Aliidongia sp.]
MFQAFRPATRAVAAAALLSGFAVALPALAQTSPPSTTTSATTAPAAAATAPSSVATAPAATPKAEKHSQRVEAHIADLKKKLTITPAQDATWETFAQVMRDNGQAMEEAIQERESTKDLDAIHDLQSYAKVAQVHADGAQKLAAAFQPVYDSLSPAQKKNADTMFEHTRHGTKEAAKKK